MEERVFLIISGAELFMGVLGICNLTLPMSRFILWGFMAVYAAIVLRGHYSRREKMLLGVLLVFGAVFYLNTGLNTGIKAPIYIYALKNVDKKKYCKMNLLVLTVTSLGIAIASKFAGFGSEYIMDNREFRLFDGVRWYSFGYPNPNRAMAVIFIIMVMFLHVYVDRIKWYGYLEIASIFTIFYYLTDSKTALVVGILVLLLSVCTKYVGQKSWNSVVFVMFLFVFSGMLLVSVLAACHYESDWMTEIDHIISGRIHQLAVHPGSENDALAYAENWRLFGSRINQGGYDMGYVQIFYYYGIVPAICYLVFILYAAIRAWKTKQTAQLVLLLGFSVYLFMENVYFGNFIPINYLLVYGAIIVWGAYENEEKKSVSGDFSSYLRRRALYGGTWGL